MSNTKHPHIVVLCLDTVRKDYYDQYAPRLRDLATVRFEEMRALSSWSVPSHAGMLTGNVPSETGVHAEQRSFDAIDRTDTWVDEFSSSGYKTICISANVYASPVFGFDRFFDETISISPSRRFPEGMDIQQFIMERDDEGPRSYIEFLKTVATHDNPVKSILNGLLLKTEDLSTGLPLKKPFDYGGKSIKRTLQRSLNQADGPMLAFANLMDVHGPHAPFRGLDTSLYEASNSFDSTSFKDWDISVSDGLSEYEDTVETVRQLYRAEVDYLDKLLSNFVQEANEELERDIVFVVTADHGENLGYEDEGYLMNHVSSLSEALLHVPFDVIAPDYETETIDDLASHADLGRILRSLRDGDPLSGFTRDIARAEIVGSGSGLPDDGDETFWDRSQRGIYRGERKYYCDELGNQAVYDVSGDSSSSEEMPGKPVPDGLFEQHFSAWVSKPDDTDYTEDLDQSTESRLEDLGYL